MLKRSRISWLIILIVLGAALPGCIPEKRSEVVGPPATVTMIKPPLATDAVNREIEFLQGILDSKRLEDEDQKALAAALLSAYRKVGEESQGRLTDERYRAIIKTLFDSLNRLGEAYFSRRKQVEPSHSEVIGLFSKKRKKILDSYLLGDYQGVIDECAALEADFGHEALTPDIRLIFAFALAKKERLPEAVRIGEEVLPELEATPGLLQLSSEIIEWQLALGNREKALALYEKMTDQANEREGLLKRIGQEVAGSEKGMAEQQQPLSGNKPPEGAEEKEPDSLEALMKKVNELVERGAFVDAKLLLIRYGLKAGEGETETIDQALKTVGLAEERYQQEKEARVSPEKEAMDQAVKLIEEEKFEEALTKLDALKDEQDLASDAKEIRDVAIEKLIKQESNRAASIFLTAKNTNDPEKRKELLLSARNILKSLIEKYPSSDLNKKLNSYLKSVDEELGKLASEAGH